MSTNHENEVETSELKKEPDLSGEPDANAFAADSSPTEGNAAEASGHTAHAEGGFTKATNNSFCMRS